MKSNTGSQVQTCVVFKGFGKSGFEEITCSRFDKLDSTKVENIGSPVSVLLVDLINRDVKSSISPLAHRQGLINPELCRCHRLTLREGRQVEPKLLPIWTRLQEVALLLH